MVDFLILSEFHSQRTAILMLLDKIRPLLNKPYVEAWPPLALFRDQLTKSIRDFQFFKHESIFDPILENEITTSDTAVVKSLKTDCIILANQYDQFRQKWSQMNISLNWPEYRLSAISMMTMIRKGIADQDTAIRQLRPYDLRRK